MRHRTAPLLALLTLLGATACETTWDTPNRDVHGPRDTERYIEMLEEEQRVASLKVELALEQLALAPDAWVGDLGCGPGTFALPLAESCPDGLVFASDIEPLQLDRLRERAAQAELTNVIPVLASYHDPHFPPGRLDLVLIVDTLHHLDYRREYLRQLQRSLKPGGRLVVLEYKPGDLPVGPPADKKLAEGELEADMDAAGWVELERFDTHPNHDFVVFGPAGA